MNLDALRKQEDEDNKLIEALSRSRRLNVYRQLHRAYNCTMDGIDHAYIAAFAKEEKAGTS